MVKKMKPNESVLNDGILDGFKVLEDFTVKRTSDTLPKEDAKRVDDEWRELYEKKLVKCSADGPESVEYDFHTGDIFYFDETPMSRDLVLEIIKNHKEKIEELY